mmetsp:Transcript_22951/g.37988  ORF Transcript_22951/g.37988 Transcript_22951/m.37988 type:complete len:210 (-) Transcript_22951:52-681(-)
MPTASGWSVMISSSSAPVCASNATANAFAPVSPRRLSLKSRLTRPVLVTSAAAIALVPSALIPQPLSCRFVRTVFLPRASAKMAAPSSPSTVPRKSMSPRALLANNILASALEMLWLTSVSSARNTSVSSCGLAVTAFRISSASVTVRSLSRKERCLMLFDVDKAFASSSTWAWLKGSNCKPKPLQPISTSVLPLKSFRLHIFSGIAWH